MRSLDFATSVKSLPPGRAIVLTALSTLLAAADWLPGNPYVDPDVIEFILSMMLGGGAIAITLRDRIDGPILARWAGRIALFSFTLVQLLGVTEYLTRWTFQDVTTSSDNGGYFSRRWARTNPVHLNAWGFRERAFDAVKAPGAYRIAVVGDSFTFGNGIRQQDRFSDLLQAHLPGHFEVLNFGRPGANTPEHRQLVESLITQIHPDFVLLQWYVNDTEDDDSGARPKSLPLMPIRFLHDWLNERSALYTVANMQWAETQVALGWTNSYEEYLKRRLGDPNSHDSLLDRRLLTELIDVCQRQEVPLGIVLFPDTAASLGADYPFGYLHQRVLDVCAAQSITCLDLRRDFSLIHERRSLWANRLDHHPSALANEIAAERILEVFSQKWVAPPSR